MTHPRNIPNGAPVRGWLSWLLAGTLSVALCFAMEVPQAKAEPTPPAPTPDAAAAAVAAADADGDGLPDQPDTLSAGATARVLGVAVEDLSQRTGQVRVLINPDGTSEQESHAAPVWVKNADGQWVDVDYTLVPRAKGGGFAPKASPSSVVIDAGGTREFARMDLPGGGSTIWSWPEPLPTPTVEGATATYSVADGVDLLVIATGMGVSTRIRINSPDAVVPEFTVQIRTEGVALKETSKGQLFFVDGKDRAGQTSTLTAWDGRLDAAGDPLEIVPVEASLDKTGSKGDRTDQDLTLTTPDALVDDPNVAASGTIGVDCSGLVSLAFGIPKMTAATLINSKYFTRFSLPKKNKDLLKFIRPGDIIEHPGHIVIYLGPAGKDKNGLRLRIAESTTTSKHIDRVVIWTRSIKSFSGWRWAHYYNFDPRGLDD